LGPVPHVSQDVDAVTVEFRQSRGGPVVTALMADASLGDIGTAYPWRTFRWYMGQKHYSGWYWSTTDQCSVIYESRLELCRLLYADFDLAVRHIVAQPFLLKSAVKGVVRRHVPDFLLITEAGPLVVDVKPKNKLAEATVADTLAWTRAAIESRGWSYEVWGEPLAVELNNLRFLSGFRRAQQFRPELVSELRNADLDNVSIGAATEGLAGWPRPLVRSTLLHLLWLQYFHVDLSRPLSASHILAPGAAR
jgi:hypothetical protein